MLIRLLSIALFFVSSAASAVPIAQGYSAQMFLRDCTVKGCAGPPFTSPSYFISYAQNNVSLNNPADAQLIIDRGDPPSLIGSGSVSAGVPSSSFYPELKTYAASNANTRFVSFARGIQGYQNTTNAAMNLSLDAQVDGMINKESQILSTTDGDGNPTTAESAFTAVVSLVKNNTGFFDTTLAQGPNPSFEAFYNDRCLQQAGNALAEGCGLGATLLYRQIANVLNDGSFNLSLGSNQMFTLNPGETIFFYAASVSVAVNGGSVDSRNTLTALFRDAAGNPITGRDGLALVRHVPEPGTLGLMAIGLIALTWRRFKLSPRI